jgi:hypothetical protein
MDEIYREIYAQLFYSGYPRPGFYNMDEYSVAQIGFEEGSIRRLVDELEIGLVSEKRQTLRSDAKYLLLLNFVEMIAKPVANRKWKERP